MRFRYPRARGLAFSTYQVNRGQSRAQIVGIDRADTVVVVGDLGVLGRDGAWASVDLRPGLQTSCSSMSSHLIDCGAERCLLCDRGASIASSIAGFSSVEMSGVISSPLARVRRSRRMILPERVLGDSGVAEPDFIRLGDRSNFFRIPSYATLLRSCGHSFPPGRSPFSTTNATMASLLISSGLPTTAASATQGLATSADSISMVPETVPCNVQHVVDAAHDPEIPVQVPVGRITGQIVFAAQFLLEVSVLEPFRSPHNVRACGETGV